MTELEKYARKTSIQRLSEFYKEWLKEKQKDADEPIMAWELVEFFEYVESSIWNGW